MRTPSERENGIVAILDALGAASYGDAEIKRFMDSQESVLQLLNQKVEDILGDIKASMITTFAFNDTILIILRTGAEEPRTGPFPGESSRTRKECFSQGAAPFNLRRILSPNGAVLPTTPQLPARIR